MGVSRLTRLHVRGLEQVVDADSDELFNWPWIYMEHGNGWNLTENEVARLARIFFARRIFVVGRHAWRL